MKLKLILLLLTAISTLHAGSLKLADITTPTTKACTDIACALGNHSGKLTAAAVIAGSFMYKHASIELNKIDIATQDINYLRAAVLESPDHQNASHYSKTVDLQNAIKKYHETGKLVNEMKASFLRAQGNVKYWEELESQGFPDASAKLNDAREQLANIKKLLEKTEKEKKESKTTMDKFFDAELREANQPELRAYYTKLLYCSAFLTLASLLSYSIYKAYPKLHTWYSTYVNPTVANAA